MLDDLRVRCLAVTLAACAAVVAAGATPAHAIAHGASADDGDYPFAVKLTMIGLPDGDGGRRDSACSGGLIAPRWVLTAGHCFRDAQRVRVSKPVAKRTIATVGRADLSGSAGHQARVIAVRQSSVADVAVVQLDRAITDITPMRLNRAAPASGLRVRLVGFGLLDGDDADLPDRLQVGEFAVTSVSRYALGMTGRAPQDDTSPCPHDSGGPYFTRDKKGVATVVGVVSGGPECPHTGPDRSGRIDTIAKWILGVIGPLPAPSRSAPARRTSPPPVAAPPAAPAPPVSLPLVAAASGTGLVIIAALITAGGRRNRRRSRHRRR